MGGATSYGNLYARFNMLYQVDMELAVVSQIADI